MSGRRRVMALALAAAGAALLGGACRAVLGIEDPPDFQCGGVVMASPECGACVDARCCAEEGACGAVDACRSAADTLFSCDPGAAACRVASTPTVPPDGFDALARCKFLECSAECGTCGALVDAFGPACDTCIQSYCCAPSVACADDADCRARFSCIHDCTILPDCTGDCLQNPSKNPLADAFQSCVAGSCAVECRIGFDLDCVKGYGWGHVTEDTKIRYTITVLELLDRKPVPHASVQLCDALTGSCQDTQTDENGEAPFDVALTKGQSFGSVVRLGAGGYRSMLAVSNRFLTKDTDVTFFTISDANFDFLVKQFKLKLDPGKAMVIATALDCRGFGAQNVRFDLSPEQPNAAVTYFQAPGVFKTSKTGTAAFGNVELPGAEPTGVINVTSVLVDPDTGAELQIHGGLVLPLEADLITQVQIYPGTN